MKGYIYKISKIDNDNITYIGSTIININYRWTEHLNIDKNSCSIGKYLRQYGADKFKFELVKEYDIFDEQHLRAYEQIWINKYKLNGICINKYDAVAYLNKEKNITKCKKYREDNKDKINQYYQDNKEKFKERSDKWFKNNKEKNKKRCKKYREKNKEKVKQYYQNNKEKKNENSKKWYENNKDKLQEKINCPICNSLVKKYNLTTHKKTKKCKKIQNIILIQSKIRMFIEMKKYIRK